MRNFLGRWSVERAPYALPKGTPALQDGPFQTRRCFFISAAGTIGLVGSAGFLVGRTSASPPATEAELAASLAQMELAWARAVARGPVEDLLRDYVSFLSVVEMHETESALWLGVDRLARAALSREGEGSTKLLERLMLTILRPSTPANLREYIPRLEERVRVLNGR